MKRVAIWGAGALGEFTIKQIEAYFSKIICIKAVLDSNDGLSGKVLLGHKVQAPEASMIKELDYIFVCSKSYQEISGVLIQRYNVSPQNIIRVVCYWPEGVDLEPRLKWEKLSFEFEEGDGESLINEIKDSYGILNSLGMEFVTDKAICMKIDRGFRLTHDYLRLYERMLPEREKNVRLLELGCGTGASLKMWKEYYKCGQIVGIDIDKNATKFEEERVDVIIGNAATLELKDKLCTKYDAFNVIIDDASHAWGDIRTSFELLWDVLESGGVYVAEDICCGSYGSFPQYPPQILDSIPIIDYFKYRLNILQSPKDWNPEYNTDKFYMYPTQIRKIEREIDCVSFIHGSIIIRKA